jgi:hypothetical protein
LAETRTGCAIVLVVEGEETTAISLRAFRVQTVLNALALKLDKGVRDFGCHVQFDSAGIDCAQNLIIAALAFGTGVSIVQHEHAGSKQLSAR